MLQGDLSAAATQIGNAVPYLLGRAVMDAVVLAATGQIHNPAPVLSGWVDSGTTLIFCSDKSLSPVHSE